MSIIESGVYARAGWAESMLSEHAHLARTSFGTRGGLVWLEEVSAVVGRPFVEKGFG